MIYIGNKTLSILIVAVLVTSLLSTWLILGDLQTQIEENCLPKILNCTYEQIEFITDNKDICNNTESVYDGIVSSYFNEQFQLCFIKVLNKVC